MLEPKYNHYCSDGDFSIQNSKQDLCRIAKRIKQSILDIHPGENVYVGVAYVYGRKLYQQAYVAPFGMDKSFASLEIIDILEKIVRCNNEKIAGPGIVIV